MLFVSSLYTRGGNASRDSVPLNLCIYDEARMGSAEDAREMVHYRLGHGHGLLRRDQAS
jgi:hypothetical protein